MEKYDRRWKTHTRGRIHCKAALENVKLNPLEPGGWNGCVYVSLAEKQETEKRCLLLSCDTATYLRCEHLLKAYERAQRGRRVIFDPGAGGNYKQTQLVRERGKGCYYVMCDYDHFDQQHSLASLAMVTRVICEKGGYNVEMVAKLAYSWCRM